MAVPDKTVESAAESLFGDERLRSNLTDGEANLVLNWATGWLDKRANVAAPATGAPTVAKVSGPRRVSQADVDRVRQMVSAINDIARKPGAPRLADAVAALAAGPAAGDQPLTRQEVLSLLTVLAQSLLDLRPPRK